MLYQTTDIRQLVAKLYRDLRLNEATYDLDFVEWIGEALSHIGAYAQFDKKEAVLSVSSFKAALPAGLVQLLGVVSSEDTAIADIKEEAKYAILPSEAHFHKGIHTGGFKDGELAGYEYTLTPGYIHLPFETGAVVIAYLAIATSADGFPLVPDDPSFFDACKWYCATRLTEGGWQHPGGLNFEQCEGRWLKYCTQARNAANMPDVSSTTRFMESWVRFIPDYQASLRQFTSGQTYDGTSYDNTDIDMS